MATLDNNNNNKIRVFSLKLSTGEHVLTELVMSEDENDDMLLMMNPLVVRHQQTSDGEITTVKEYDPFTDETQFVIHWDRVISKPTIVNDFYRGFYAHALLHARVKRTRFFLANLDVSDEELKEHVEDCNQSLSTYAGTLIRRYGVDIEYDFNVADDENKVPPGTTIH